MELWRTVARVVVVLGFVSQAALAETWHLEEVWRVSGDDPEAPLLGVISRAVADSDGSILMLDTQLAQVVVFSASGEFLGKLSGKGEGPGELQNPSDVFLLSDGTVGLSQDFPKRIISLTRDGDPAGVIRSNSLMGIYRQVREASGVLVVSTQQMDASRSERSANTYVHEIRRQSRSGELQQTYLAKTIRTSINPATFDEAAVDFPGRVWDLMVDGTLVVAVERDLYRLLLYPPDGGAVRVIEREFETYRRTEDEVRELVAKQIYTVGSRKIQVKSKFEPTERAIQGVQVMADGSIWVSTCFAERDLPEGVFQRFDVFEADGQWRDEVLLEMDGNHEQDKLIALNDGRFLLVKNLRSAGSDEDGVLEVICLKRVD